MKKVIVREVPDDVDHIHDHPLLHRIFAARGITSSSEIDYELKNLLFYGSLKGINQAVEILVEVLKSDQHVLILGDFDTDGATSVALAALALKSFGLAKVSYLIPSRFEYGYGLTPEIVGEASKQNPDLIMTVDNGISSIDGVNEANKRGIKVLITDHHLPGDLLPEAFAIVNPNQKDDEFASKNLAGVGVVFYLMLALRSRLRDINWFSSQDIVEPNMSQFLDLVALGTIADTVNLDVTNRILVTHGISRIQKGESRIGINALFTVSNRNYERASVNDLGFAIAPRLNASGRLDNMLLGVECLLTEDPARARSIARELNKLNEERRGIEGDMQKQAERILDNVKLEREELPAGVCVFEETWHQGVLGILSSRLKDKLNRPVVAFASASVGEDEIKGSVRSIDSVHIRDLLNNIATKNPGLIIRFGGHAMAAGLSLHRDNYETFSQIFSEEVGRCLKADDVKGIVYTDGELSGEYLNINTAELLQEAGPWGAGFSDPLFFDEFIIVKQSLVGSKHLKLVLRNPETDQEVDAIHFNVDTNVWPNPRFSKVKIVYKLSVNEYNGRRSLQLMINEIISYE